MKESGAASGGRQPVAALAHQRGPRRSSAVEGARASLKVGLPLPVKEGFAKKTPELSLRGRQFQPIGLRSEVTGDAETASEAAAVAFPVARGKDLVINIVGPDEAAGLGLVRVLIHQLEVEVEVGDRVPADVGADDPRGRARRYRAVGELDDAAAEAQEIAAAAL